MNMEDKVNEILGLEKLPEDKKPETKAFSPPVKRKTGEVEIKVEKDINENIAQKETNLLKNSPLIK